MMGAKRKYNCAEERHGVTWPWEQPSYCREIWEKSSDRCIQNPPFPSVRFGDGQTGKFKFQGTSE